MKTFNLQEALGGAEIIGKFQDDTLYRFIDLKYWGTSRLTHKLHLVMEDGGLWRFNDDGLSEHKSMQLFLTAK